MAAETSQFQRPVSSRLNSTGKVINLSVPFKEGERVLGDVAVRIGTDDAVSVSKAQIVPVLGAVLDAPALTRLAQISDRAGMVGLPDFATVGLDVRFDPTLLELVLHAQASQKAVDEISLGGRRQNINSAAALRPALFSAYVNIFAGVDYLWGLEHGDDRAAGRMDLEAVFRIAKFVVENDFSWEGSVDAFACPVSAICTYDHQAGLKRRRSRLVYDFVDEQVRVQLGDVETFGSALQRAPDLLGLTIEKSPRKLAPSDHIRPTGASSFRLDTAASVEILINGVPTQRLQLRPGSYKLRDLPLATGANEVTLLITDETGQRSELKYTSFFDGSLLAAGKSEWSFSGGVPSFVRDNERDYATEGYLATGFYRRGLTDAVTGEVHIQGDDRIVMGGLGVFSATPWGYFGLQGAMSAGPDGEGFAVNFNWALANIEGLAHAVTGFRESFHFSAEYRSPEFRAPGEDLITASGIYQPQQLYWLRLHSSYSVPITQSVSMTVGARYQFSAEDQVRLTPYVVKGDRYGFDVTLSSPLSTWLTASVTAGYSNETQLRFAAKDPAELQSADGEFRVMARFYARPSENTRLLASYDTLNQDSYLSGQYATGRGIDRWETFIDLQQSAHDDRALSTGTIARYANRGEVRISHTVNYDDVNWNRIAPALAEQRSSIRVGTAIAFADGAFGWGQPIRGNGFAIVHPHESIRSNDIVVGSKEEVLARADRWGAVILPNIPAYSSHTTPIDVPDAPLGYSLGAGGFDTFAPYRAGYSYQVGSSYSISAFGTLLGEDDAPLALLTGVAYQAREPARQVAIFTNAAGKFAAEGLAPGRWIIAMETEPKATRYVVDLPKGSQGLVKVGTIKPSASQKGTE